MTFKEIFESGAHLYFHTYEFEKNGIQLIENTPDEILDVSIEMSERLNNTWETTKEEKELQELFRSLIPKNKYPVKFRASIGSKFLRQNQELLRD